MVQATLPLKNQKRAVRSRLESAREVGLSCEADVVTLRFLGDSQEWGQQIRQIRLDRKLAEELSRLLNYELEYEWEWK